jgi:hypothetical protein
MKLIPQERAGLICTSAPLALKLADYSVDLFHRELIQRDNLGLRAKSWRQDAPCLLLAISLHGYPSGMLPVHAPPVGVRYVMRAGREKNLNNASTCQLFILMMNFNEKSLHF